MRSRIWPEWPNGLNPFWISVSGGIYCIVWSKPNPKIPIRSEVIPRTDGRTRRKHKQPGRLLNNAAVGAAKGSYFFSTVLRKVLLHLHGNCGTNIVERCNIAFSYTLCSKQPSATASWKFTSRPTLISPPRFTQHLSLNLNMSFTHAQLGRESGSESAILEEFIETISLLTVWREFSDFVS